MSKNVFFVKRSSALILFFFPNLGDNAKINGDSIGIGVARVGHDDQKMVAAPLKELLDTDFGSPLHSLVIPGHLHILEEDAVNFLKINK